MRRLAARTKTNVLVRDSQGRIPLDVKHPKYIRDALLRLAAYEDAEENGLLLMLPCRVGDGVYRAINTRGCKNCINKDGLCSGGRCPEPKIFESTFTLHDVHCLEDIFTTREEAEAALSKLQITNE